MANLTALKRVSRGYVRHWSGYDIPKKSCGTCAHSFPNCSAVGIRLGCREEHVPFLSFTLPHRLDCGGKDWEQRK